MEVSARINVPDSADTVILWAYSKLNYIAIRQCEYDSDRPRPIYLCFNTIYRYGLFVYRVSKIKISQHENRDICPV